MLDSEVSEEDLMRIPRLAEDCDSTALELSPAEGFLLSRIDGQTSWKLLREFGGLSPDQVDLCIEEWLMEGVIDIDGRAPRVKRRESAIPEMPNARKVAAPASIDESLIDPSLDLDEKTQREMLEFELRLESNYFDLLGVNTTANSGEIKRAYFALSKRFHPDRYFRKNTGEYGERLHAIFKRVCEAYETLSDPARRQEIEERLVREVRSGSQSETLTPDQSDFGHRVPLTPPERLRQLMPFRVPDAVRDQKSAKGDELFRSAQESLKLGRQSEAAANMRLAVAFDPFNREYKRALDEMQSDIALEKIHTLLEDAAGVASDSEKGEAQRLVEEVMLYRPNDDVVVGLAAKVCLYIENAERAEEYCTRAIEMAPEVGAHHVCMAGIHRLRGNKGHAVAALNRALELDSQDQEARTMLEMLKVKPRRA